MRKCKGKNSTIGKLYKLLQSTLTTASVLIQHSIKNAPNTKYNKHQLLPWAQLCVVKLLHVLVNKDVADFLVNQANDFPSQV